MAINEEYQMQAQNFKEKELQYADLAREYRDKLEAVKFERERIALKEEQFLRQIQKSETNSKNDMRRHTERVEAQSQAKKREFDRKLDEYEERISTLGDEKESAVRRLERAERENQDLKRQVDQFISKEDRTIAQYEKIMDQLKAEIKDKERQCHAIETREAYAKQELKKYQR